MLQCVVFNYNNIATTTQEHYDYSKHRNNQIMISLIGKRFGRLLVKSIAGSNDARLIVYNCQCDCGNVKQVASRNLIRQSTKSCGCLKKEMYKLKKNSQRFVKVVI